MIGPAFLVMLARNPVCEKPQQNAVPIWYIGQDPAHFPGGAQPHGIGIVAASNSRRHGPKRFPRRKSEPRSESLRHRDRGICGRTREAWPPPAFLCARVGRPCCRTASLQRRASRILNAVTAGAQPRRLAHASIRSAMFQIGTGPTGAVPKAGPNRQDGPHAQTPGPSGANVRSVLGGRGSRKDHRRAHSLSGSGPSLCAGRLSKACREHSQDAANRIQFRQVQNGPPRS